MRFLPQNYTTGIEWLLYTMTITFHMGGYFYSQFFIVD